MEEREDHNRKQQTSLGCLPAVGIGRSNLEFQITRDVLQFRSTQVKHNINLKPREEKVTAPVIITTT
jgi:hypothetical protein